MKINWIDILLIILGLIIIYQLTLKIFGESWQTESLILAFLMLNLGLTWKLSMNILKLDLKFDGHID
jgi:hypothetical protein